jgi:hypothetical protein
VDKSHKRSQIRRRSVIRKVSAWLIYFVVAVHQFAGCCSSSVRNWSRLHEFTVLCSWSGSRWILFALEVQPLNTRNRENHSTRRRNKWYIQNPFSMN